MNLISKKEIKNIKSPFSKWYSNFIPELTLIFLVFGIIFFIFASLVHKFS